MAERWTHDPQYSHGYLVPVFALVLLWYRRESIRGESFQGSPWGFALIVPGLLLYLAGSLLYFHPLDAISLLPCVFGVCLLLGGWNALRWAWPSLAFLVFMLPLPFQVEKALASPLQQLATALSTQALQLLGFLATSEGNVIRINDDITIKVAEACSGLSMLLTFFALSAAFALIVRRPLLDQVVLIASAIPIAVFANVVRITLTGVLYDRAGAWAGRLFFHDLAGWFMIVLALVVLWLEQAVLDRLLLEPDSEST
jgi:exosortase